MNANGSGAVRLTTGSGGSFEPCWSPDGAKIAFVKFNDDIYVMNPNGSNQTGLTSGTAWTLTLPGRRMAGRSPLPRREPGDSDIWVMDANGSNQTNLTNTGSSETEPRLVA